MAAVEAFRLRWRSPLSSLSSEDAEARSSVEEGDEVSSEVAEEAKEPSCSKQSSKTPTQSMIKDKMAKIPERKEFLRTDVVGSEIASLQ